jgi:hypothetical protein
MQVDYNLQSKLASPSDSTAQDGGPIFSLISFPFNGKVSPRKIGKLALVIWFSTCDIPCPITDRETDMVQSVTKPVSTDISGMEKECRTLRS